MNNLHEALECDEEGRKSFPIALSWLMSNASEDCYCAGWLMGCEHTLWDAAHAGGDFDWGQSTVKRRTLDAMLELSEACGLWVHWPDDDRGRPGDGPQTIPIDEWLKLHAEWEAKGRR